MTNNNYNVQTDEQIARDILSILPDAPEEPNKEPTESPKVFMLPIRQLKSFQNHPFKIVDNEEMKDLMHSIYDHKKDGNNVLKATIVNPAYLIKPEKETSRISVDDLSGGRDVFAETLIASGKIDAEEYELFKAYMAERMRTPNDVIFNVNGAPVTFEDYKAYHNATELAGGELLDSGGKRIELKDFVREDRIVPDVPEHDITIDFTEDDMRVTQYFERCLLKELQNKVAVLQKAIDILKNDKTA